MLTGLVFNIQRYSIHNGPGIRTTVFLKGCPLRCTWCHNPESKSMARELSVNESRCARCGECWEACPQDHSLLERNGPLIDRQQCIRCGLCVDACTSDARQLTGNPMTVAETLAEIKKDQIFFDDSGGGMTLSGGEPLLQPEFARELLAACRRTGIATAVDTCGHVDRDALLEVAPLTDVFLYDIKTTIAQRHLLYTGVSNERILENLAALSQVHTRIWIRIPVIPGFNDDPDDLAATADLAATTPGVCQVNLLPYHDLGMHKLERLGTLRNLDAFTTPSDAAMETAARPFQTLGLNVKIGG